MGYKDSPVKKKRLIFIDVMRGIAVIWMIETHVVDVFLDNSLKHGSFYTLLNISNGFVAVAFIFCAGAGFWLAAMRKSADYKAFGQPLFVYLRRLFMILVIAYALHFPVPSLSGLFNVSASGWIVFFESDVLQCIVYTSLIALFILMITPKLNYLPWIFAILTVLVFFTSPIIRSWDAMGHLPPFWAALITGPPVSKFPLVPWSGYFFGGVAVTAFFMNSKNKHRTALAFFLVGLALAFFFQYSKILGVGYPGITNWWLGSPGHSLFRLSGTISVFGLLFLLEKYYAKTGPGNVLKLSGQESLFLYVSHLLIVYNSANFGIDKLLGTGFGYGITFLIFVSVALLCYFAAVFWHNLKFDNMRKARLVMAITFGLLIAFFVINPA